MNSFLFPSFLFFEINQNVITISEPCFICPTIKYAIPLYEFAVSKSLNKWLTRDTNKWILLVFQRLQSQHIPIRSSSDEYFALFKPGAAMWRMFFHFFSDFQFQFFPHSVFPLKDLQRCSWGELHTYYKRNTGSKLFNWRNVIWKMKQTFRGQYIFLIQ